MARAVFNDLWGSAGKNRSVRVESRLYEVDRALVAAVDRVTGRKTCPATRSFAAGTVNLEEPESPLRSRHGTVNVGLRMIALLVTAFIVASAQPGPHRDFGTLSAPAAAVAVGQPSDVVLAVDESGSITAPELALEKQAAQVALADVAPGSQVEVIGFGGIDSGQSDANPETPFDLTCPLATADTGASYQQLESCIAGLHVRHMGQGENTDFYSVLAQAVTDLHAHGVAGRPENVFMVTDGALDVAGTNNPATPANVNAQTRLFAPDGPLAAATQDGIDVWGLGIGMGADMTELTNFAHAGGQNACSGLASAKPHAIRISDAGELPDQLARLFAGAECAVVSGSNPLTATIRGPQVEQFTVQVPQLAAVSVIEAERLDPSIQVRFTEPDGKAAPLSGTVADSAYQLEGSDGPVVALRVTDPEPGPWTVTFDAPANVTEQIAANVFWQGEIKADLAVTAAQPRPGDSDTATVQIEVRDRLPHSADTLAGVTVSLSVGGDGFATIGPLDLPADGSTPGMYSTTFRVPSTASGALKFTATVDGPGLTSDTEVESGKIQPATAYLSAQFAFPQATARPGADVPVQLQLSNESGTARTLLIQLRGAPNGMTVTPSVVTLPAASGGFVDTLTLHLPAGLSRGVQPGTLEVFDQADTSTALGSSRVQVTVTPPLPPYQQYLWALILMAGLAAAAVCILILKFRVHRRKADMADIELQLYIGDHRQSSLYAPDGCGGVFGFEIDRVSSSGARLDHDLNGAGYRARRERYGGLNVRLPDDGDSLLLSPGTPTELGEGLRLGFIDHRNDPLPGDDAQPPAFDGSRSRRSRWRRAVDEFEQPLPGDEPA
jgi:hypothetical protein